MKTFFSKCLEGHDFCYDRFQNFKKGINLHWIILYKLNKNLGKSNLFKIRQVLSGKLLKIPIEDDLVFHDDVSETIEKIHNSTFRVKI